MAGFEGAWRIVVRIGATQPELQAALAPLPVRARAERLRQLALVGLHCLRTGTPPAPVAETGAMDTELSARRARLVRSLGVDIEMM